MVMNTENDREKYHYCLVICDVNDLKYVNDRFGHDHGDEYIQKACRMIFDVFKKSPVFRTGGDEFAVILEGEDDANCDVLLSQLQETSFQNAKTEDGIVVAAGIAVKRDNEGFHSVFHRADEQMYIHKSRLKEIRPSHNLR